ncbi:MAG TPA: FliM/FliN family flagellar motor C-terminal domain-containing protein [Candidatus Tyrphobacter sp.]
MKHLVFARMPGVRCGVFEERSLLPVSAACIVANAMRERLATLCGTSVDLRLWPPAIPCASAWKTILRGAQLHVIRATLCDAAIVLRPHDAQALAALLFGERSASERAERALSPLESEITRRAVAAVAVTLAPVCGEGHVDASPPRIDFVTYFELHVLEPAQFCIGIALSREPPPASAAAVSPQHLTHSNITASVEVALAPASAAQVAGLRPGDVLRALPERAVMRVNGFRCALGRCGVRAEHYAFEVQAA